MDASLLIEALSEFCPDPVAENPWPIAFSYVCGFMPWAFLALFDFISPKWNSIRHDRRAGVLHPFGSIAPMSVVFSYPYVQGRSAEFKEMMTAVSALLLNLYHLAYSAWKLAQLRAYRAWCKHAFACIC